ncbi:hypothetical protein ACFX12_021147 [Malus domestica]
MARDKIKNSSFFSFCFIRKLKLANPNYDQSPSSEALLPPNGDHLHRSDSSTVVQSKPGWKAVIYILGNESIEKMASYGLTINFMVYLVREYHMEQVPAANMINNWASSCFLLTVIGGSIADIYLGKFLTIALASFATLLGMLTVTLTAFVPQLRPPPCTLNGQQQQCVSSTKTQLGFLIVGLCGLGLGTGGIRPCSIPFGVDQFDSATVEGRKSVTTFLNLYYAISCMVILINQSLVMYIQDSVSWALGFAIPTLLMSCAILLFFGGSKIYFYVKPEGSTFSSFAQVLVAAYKKRHLKLHNDDRVHGVFSDDDSSNGNGRRVLNKLHLSTEFSFLKKAALVVDNELKDDGSCATPSRLCSIQQVEEVIRVMKILPVSVSGVISLLALAQEPTFVVSQAMKMDRHIGPNFAIPAGSVKMMSIMTLFISLTLYDRVLQRALTKFTKCEDGIPPLRRIGIGYFFSAMCMVVAGLVEQQRRALATSQASSNGVVAMSVFWLFPQEMLLGLCEMFGVVGLLEFYNKEFPETMKSIGNSLLYLCLAGASCLSSVTVSIVHGVTGKHGRPNWLDNDINAGRLDYFYFLIAGLGVVNFFYFLFCARGYAYKASAETVESLDESLGHPLLMMAEGKKQKQQQSSHCLYVTKFFQKSTSSELSHKFPLSPDKEPVDRKRDVAKKPGGWKAMPFILGNDTFERLAAIGLLANFMVYLTRMLHLDQVSASNIINVWSGLTNFAPLLGAFISDAYVGRFRTIVFASISSLMGMATVTLTAWLPQLHPPPCSLQQQALSQCTGPTRAQLGLLLSGLGFLSIGTAGIRPCSIPFGVDQFDPTTEEGKKGVNSFFNWYYATFTVVLLLSQTVVVYIQDKVSWSLGFGIPTVLMACSILLLFFGSRVYVHAKPQGSMFSGIAQVLVAAHKKRHIELAEEAEIIDVDKFYHPPIFKGYYASKLPLTNQLR